MLEKCSCLLFRWRWRRILDTNISISAFTELHTSSSHPKRVSAQHVSLPSPYYIILHTLFITLHSLNVRVIRQISTSKKILCTFYKCRLSGKIARNITQKISVTFLPVNVSHFLRKFLSLFSLVNFRNFLFEKFPSFVNFCHFFLCRKLP